MRSHSPTCGFTTCFRLLCFISFIYSVYFVLLSKVSLPKIINENDLSSFKAFQAVNSVNCSQHIREAKGFLSYENISYSCKALEEDGCNLTYNYYFQRADPLSVFLRSSSCDLDWPQYRSISQEELKFPLAYFFTTFTDARNLELTLATIFRPHNS